MGHSRFQRCVDIAANGTSEISYSFSAKISAWTSRKQTVLSAEQYQLPLVKYSLSVVFVVINIFCVRQDYYMEEKY